MSENSPGGTPPQRSEYPENEPEAAHVSRPSCHAAEAVEGQSLTVRLGHFFFSFRDYLFPLTFVLFLVTTTPGRPFGSERWDTWVDILGIIIVFIGQGYRLLAAGGAENIRRRGHDGRIGAAEIIRHGIFAHSRNPLYLGNVLIIFGFVVIANNLWWYLLVLPLFIAVYFAIVLAEEEFLLQKFGAPYAEYCRTVNRFVPRLDGLYQTLANSSFDWRRAVRREYGNMCSWSVMILVLLIWERWVHFSYTARKEEFHLLFGLLVLVSLVYGGIRWGKRQGLFRS